MEYQDPIILGFWKIANNSQQWWFGVNSIPELKLIVDSNSGIGIDYLKQMELELRNFELELKFPTKTFNPEINLPFLQCFCM